MEGITKLGKYEIRRELGRGAMGVVYEAFDPLINRVVALKTIRSDQLVGDGAGDLLARFRREAQAAGRLTHPNIVAIYDLAEDAGTWFIAMELVNGRDLKSYFDANERFPAQAVLRIMEQILAALDYSHRQGVVHRDIKPANVFLLADGTVKVADFGIAHVESSELTAVGTVLGTPSYMSPEQIMGLPVDGRSDLFSAGVILYQFLTGDRPFSGSVTTTMQKVLREEPLPPSTLNVQIPPAVDAVVKKALAKRPEDRYPSAQEFSADLKSAAATDFALAAPVDATVSDPDATLRAPAAATSRAIAQVPAGGAAMPNRHGVNPSPAASAASAAARPSRTTAIVALAALALVAIGAASWFILQRGHDTPTAIVARSDGTPATSSSAASETKPGVAMPAAPAAVTPSAPVAPEITPPPGSFVIAAVGLVDGSRPQYQHDRARLKGDLRDDANAQVVEKALGLLVDRSSVAKNYDVLQRKLFANSGAFIRTVVNESEPQVRKDGFVSMRTQAVVDVAALKKSLDQMSRDERIQLIRASGDPRIAVQIAVQDADGGGPPVPSAVAENVVKERIRSFGFRTWSDQAPAADAERKGGDFVVVGEAKVKRLSARLQASGLTITKYALTSWTVKCIDRATGEEIYYNTTMPKGEGSWPSEETALAAIGGKVAGEFSRDFFLDHVSPTSTTVRLSLEGLPDAHAQDLVAAEIVGLPAVMSLRAQGASDPRAYDLQIAGRASAAEVLPQLTTPLNAKLGQGCFAAAPGAGQAIVLRLDARCADASVLGKLETSPPAALYGAPAARLDAIVSNPETRRQLNI